MAIHLDDPWVSSEALALCGKARPTLRQAHRPLRKWLIHQGMDRASQSQISGRLNIVADKVDPQTYDELVTDLTWFTFRFARGFTGKRQFRH